MIHCLKILYIEPGVLRMHISQQSLQFYQ